MFPKLVHVIISNSENLVLLSVADADLLWYLQLFDVVIVDPLLFVCAFG